MNDCLIVVESKLDLRFAISLMYSQAQLNENLLACSIMRPDGLDVLVEVETSNPAARWKVEGYHSDGEWDLTTYTFSLLCNYFEFK